jgi:flagellar hook-associated protein 3 FlgL
LAYEDLKAEDGLTITATNPDATFTTVVKESKAGDAYMPGADEVYYLADTGELIFGDNVYNTLTLTESFKFIYTREGFEAGELDPTQYFDCVDVTDPNNKITYTNRNQEIYYEVNFNQMLKINTQGKDVFTQDMTRDLDDIVVTVNQVITIQDKMDSLEALYDTTAVDSPERENVQRLINLCQRELDFGVENMTNAFSRGITLFQKHQDVVNLARADAGARHARLQLNEERLSAQRTTVENLKSTNEDADITEVTVELTEAKSIFDASLNAAAQVVQKKLLDFL